MNCKNTSTSTSIVICICILFIVTFIVTITTDNFINNGNIKSKYQNYYCSYCGKELVIGGMPPQGCNFVCSDKCLALSKIPVSPYGHHVNGVVSRYDDSDWFKTVIAFYPDSTSNRMCIDARPFQALLSLNKIRTMFSNSDVFENGKIITLDSYVTGRISFVCGTDNDGKYLEYIGNDLGFRIYESKILDNLKLVMDYYNNNVIQTSQSHNHRNSGSFGSSHQSRTSQSINRRNLGLPW